MSRTQRTIVTGVLTAIVIAGHQAFAGTKTLRQELREIDQLRAGWDTPFDEVDRRGNRLLQEYTLPGERGQIYFTLVQVEGQSGFQRPEKILEFIKNALEYPQEPLKKIRLYTYWGDAIQVTNRGVRNQELVVARRNAVMPYLQGLKETLQYDLPETPPPLPRVLVYHPSPTMDQKQWEELKRQNEEQLAARRLADLQRDMIQNREMLTRQISSMYSRFPWASEEIRQLAANVLENQEAVNRLMSYVDAAVRQRREELGWQAPLAEVSSLAQPGQEDDARIARSNLQSMQEPLTDKMQMVAGDDDPNSVIADIRGTSGSSSTRHLLLVSTIVCLIAVFVAVFGTRLVSCKN